MSWSSSLLEKLAIGKEVLMGAVLLFENQISRIHEELLPVAKLGFAKFAMVEECTGKLPLHIRRLLLQDLLFQTTATVTHLHLVHILDLSLVWLLHLLFLLLFW